MARNFETFPNLSRVVFIVCQNIQAIVVDNSVKNLERGLGENWERFGNNRERFGRESEKIWARMENKNQASDNVSNLHNIFLNVILNFIRCPKAAQIFQLLLPEFGVI